MRKPTRPKIVVFREGSSPEGPHMEDTIFCVLMLFCIFSSIIWSLYNVCGTIEK